MISNKIFVLLTNNFFSADLRAEKAKAKAKAASLEKNKTSTKGKEKPRAAHTTSSPIVKNEDSEYVIFFAVLQILTIIWMQR